MCTIEYLCFETSQNVCDCFHVVCDSLSKMLIMSTIIHVIRQWRNDGTQTGETLTLLVWSSCL